MSQTKKKKERFTLQTAIRTELRLAVMLRAFDHCKTDTSPMRTQDQHRVLYNFYHGDGPSQVSHISLLCNGLHPYDEFFEEVNIPLVVDPESTTRSTTSLRLKDFYSCCEDTFLLQRDIKLLDLRRTDRTNTTVTTGRQILRQGRSTMISVKQALGFTKLKWDIDKMCPKESGDTVEDVVAFVRQKMWSEYGPMKKKSVALEDSFETDVAIDDIDDEDGTEDNQMKDNWLFKGFFAWLAWGPFTSPENRLPIFGEEAIEDLDSIKKKTRNNKRKTEVLTKMEEHSHDDKNQRGMTHDQMINLSHVQIQREMLLQKLNEQDMIQLKIEFDSISSEIETAERRAEKRCPLYQEDNKYWMEVDQLLEERRDLRRRMSSGKTKKRKFSTPCDEIMISSQSTPSTILDHPCSDYAYGGKSLHKELNSENLSSEVIDVEGKPNDNDCTNQKDSVLVSRV